MAKMVCVALWGIFMIGSWKGCCVRCSNFNWNVSRHRCHRRLVCQLCVEIESFYINVNACNVYESMCKIVCHLSLVEGSAKVVQRIQNGYKNRKFKWSKTWDWNIIQSVYVNSRISIHFFLFSANKFCFAYTH